MEEGQKKTLMIGIIVVCLVVAGIITFANRSSSNINSIPEDETVWVKCTNKTCQTEYEMNKREYHALVEEIVRQNPMASFTPIKCEKCGNNTVLLAEKCQNPACGAIFISNSIQGDFPDRCPKCKQSATEESRNKRKREQGG